MNDSIGGARLERIVSDVVARAVRLVDPGRIWLFGSHVTGHATKGSDVDFGFEMLPGAEKGWAAFVAETRDEVPALVDLDLVDLGTCDRVLAHEITTTGRVVYERGR